MHLADIFSGSQHCVFCFIFPDQAATQLLSQGTCRLVCKFIHWRLEERSEGRETFLGENCQRPIRKK